MTQGSEYVGRSLADVMLEASTALEPELTQSLFGQYPVEQSDLELMTSRGWTVPHGLLAVMQERLGLETAEDELLSDQP